MATHQIEVELVIHFDDGSTRVLEVTEHVYYYQQQKTKYWVSWIESFMAKHPEITAKPVSIEEVNKIVECPPYQIYIGM